MILYHQVKDNVTCKNGYKFALLAGLTNRRQFLFVEGKTILAFVPYNKKFLDCEVLTDVTTSIMCQVYTLQAQDKLFSAI